MSSRTRLLMFLVMTVVSVACTIAVESAQAQTIIDQWTSVTVPPPPALKAISVDKATTALLMLDFNRQTCNMQRRPRCVASIPKVKELLSAARAAGMPVVYSLGGGGKVSDLPDALAPVAGEPVVSSGVDKFAGTDLESILKSKGVKTVIIVGAASNGAVLYTASSAVMRAMKVIVPVDGVAGDNLYSEQYTVWHLVNAPVIGAGVSLTTIAQLTF